MFTNKFYTKLMLSCLRSGRLNKFIEIACSNLELRKFASTMKYSDRLVKHVSGNQLVKHVKGE